MNNETEHNPDYAELSARLDVLDRMSDFVVDETLKQTDAATTQRGHFKNDPNHMLLRKEFRRDTGLGTVYARMMAAQHERSFNHIPYVHSCDTIGDETIVVIDYVPGETLAAAVGRCGASAELACDIFGNLCDAVSELHENFDPPIIHRDLKPENIVISATGLYIIDFGISRSFNADGEYDTVHFGTRAFAPPEQYGFAQTTVRSDVYALGLLLYFCLVGQVPNAACREAGFAQEGVSSEFSDIIAKAAAFDPEDRYESVRALKCAFAEAARDLQHGSKPEETADDFAEEDASLLDVVPVSLRIEAANEIAAALNDASRVADHVAKVAAETSAASAARNAMRPKLSLWNKCVIGAFAFFEAVGIFGPFVTTSESVASMPLAAKIIVYWFWWGIIVAACACVLYDKRQLKERHPVLKRFDWYHVWFAAAAAVVVATAITVLLYGFVMPSS